MRIAISGASGLVGTACATYFANNYNAEIIPLKRNFTTSDLSGCDVVLNLAGATINAMWSEKYKHEILDSRVNTTRRLVACLNELDVKPAVMISCSAIGIYTTAGCHDEQSKDYDSTFLAGVCRCWEDATVGLSSKIRLVVSRLAVVMSEDGGVLPKLESATLLGFGCVLGDRKSSLSWIAIDDLVRAFDHIIQSPHVDGVVNMAAPYPTTNNQLTDEICKLHDVKYKIYIPAFILKILLRQSSELVLNTQCSTPKKLLMNGFKFKYPTIQSFSASLYHV